MAVPPQDWKEKSLGDLLEFKNGFNADSAQYGSGIPFASVLDALQSTPMTEKTIKGKVQVNLLTVFPFCLKKGDLVFMRSSETLEEVGWSNVYNGTDWKALFGGFVIRGRPKVEVDSVFLNYLLRQPQYRERVINEGAGAVHYNIGQRGLARVKIPLPPLPEQHRIAEKLRTVDKLIDNLTRRIEKKRQVKQGVMQELLTGKKRLPGFTGTWNTSMLGEFVDCLRGVSYDGSRDVHTQESARTIRLLRSNNIQRGVFWNKDIQYVSRHCASGIQVLRENDIMVCMANGSKALVGKSCLFTHPFEQEYTFGAFMGCVRAKTDETNMHFVFQLLNSQEYWQHIALTLSGSSINNLRPADILNMEFKMPERSEQAAIAALLDNMDASIAKLEAKRAKCEDIKRGLMHDLLTGKVRV